MNRPMIVFSLCLLLAPAGAVAAEEATPSAPPASAPAAEEAAANERELATVKERLVEVQTEAEQTEPVRATRIEYRDKLKQEMVRAAPEMERDIDRQTKLLEELSEKRPEDLAAKNQKQLTEFQQLRQKLQPVEQQASQNETVQAARRTYFDTLMAEMKRIEPQTDALLERHRELASTVQRTRTGRPQG